MGGPRWLRRFAAAAVCLGTTAATAGCVGVEQDIQATDAALETAVGAAGTWTLAAGTGTFGDTAYCYADVALHGDASESMLVDVIEVLDDAGPCGEHATVTIGETRIDVTGRWDGALTSALAAYFMQQQPFVVGFDSEGPTVQVVTEVATLGDAIVAHQEQLALVPAEPETVTLTLDGCRGDGCDIRIVALGSLTDDEVASLGAVDALVASADDALRLDVRALLDMPRLAIVIEAPGEEGTSDDDAMAALEAADAPALAAEIEAVATAAGWEAIVTAEVGDASTTLVDTT